jgi:hypothetical protein
MARHIIDRPRAGKDGERTRAYVAIEHAENRPGRAERLLHRAASTGRDTGQRLREFLRIERGDAN